MTRFAIGRAAMFFRPRETRDPAKPSRLRMFTNDFSEPRQPIDYA